MIGIEPFEESEGITTRTAQPSTQDQTAKDTVNALPSTSNTNSPKIAVNPGKQALNSTQPVLILPPSYHLKGNSEAMVPPIVESQKAPKNKTKH